MVFPRSAGLEVREVGPVGFGSKSGMALGSEPLVNGGIITHSLYVSNASLHKSCCSQNTYLIFISDGKCPFLLATGLLKPTFVGQINLVARLGRRDYREALISQR